MVGQKYKHGLLTTTIALLWIWGHNFEVTTATEIQATCGGTLESDSDSLEYRTPLMAGDQCVWVIHLSSRMVFNLNFSSFDVGSNNLDCADGALRIYSLTNTAPPDDIQHYTFCNRQPPPASNFYIGHTVLVLVLNIQLGNLNGGTGFTLNWSGASTDPSRTTHMASYSTISEAYFRYPVFGQYGTNLLATWLIKPGSVVDLHLQDIGLEGCPLPDPCTCDAVFVYEVNSTGGQMQESRRVCGESPGNVFVEGMQPWFIVTLYTDMYNLPGGDGLTVAYLPSTSNETTTTIATTTIEEEPTTTEEVPQIIDPPCGTTLTQNAGEIEFAYGSEGQNIYCVWILRSRTYSRVTFEIERTGSTSGGIVTLSTFVRNSYPMITNRRIIDSTTLTLPGSVTLVTFSSTSPSQGNGFRMAYNFHTTSVSNISSLSVDFNSMGSTNGSIRYPSSGNYNNQELSTFLVTNPDFTYDVSRSLISIATISSMESCCDYLYLYSFDHSSGWSYFGRTNTGTTTTTGPPMRLYVLSTDTSVVGTGFSITWVA